MTLFAGQNTPAGSLAGGIFALVGLGLLLLSGGITIYEQRFLDRAVETDGVVVRMAAVSGDDGETFAPVTRFMGPRGEVEVRSNTSSKPPEFTVGEAVRVVFDPQQPEGAEIETFWQLWSGAMIVGGIGAAFVIAAIGMAFAQRQQWARRAG
ncbi:MAG: DUF3592 domain-containing protein [Acidobacteriota bacterium]